MADIEIAIEKLCYGGAGLGRVEGKACFVPFTAPGDRARIRVVKEKRSFIEGELLELLEPAPTRIAPPCAIFGSCGGCDWQFLPYAEQLRLKGDIFADSLRRLGRVESDAILPVLPSPEPYGYRSRIQLKLAVKEGKLKLGFFKCGSHQVVDAPVGCPIAHPLLNRIAAQFRALLARLPDLERLSQLDLALGDPEDSVAVLHFSGDDPAPLSRALLAARAELPEVSGLFLRCGSKSRLVKVFGVDSLGYLVPAGLWPGSRALELRFGRGGFSQVNYRQNLALIRTVWQWGELNAGMRLLDLYCGNGNLSVPIAPYLGEVIGVEGYAPSIDDARANAKANGIGNASYQVSDAALAVKRLAARGERFDLVLLDPPRSGAEQVAEIARLKPDTIIYVSCDPPTLSRDLALLAEEGYRVTRSQPVDMFPQTYHLESVTQLKRL